MEAFSSIAGIAAIASLFPTFLHTSTRNEKRTLRERNHRSNSDLFLGSRCD